MTKRRWIENEAQKQKAERVLSLLGHKIRKGIATDEEVERYTEGCEHLAVYDWGTESYRNRVPPVERNEGVVARALPEPDIPRLEPAAPRPPLKRRAGRFAV
jgi:hypothetical protein